LICPIETGVQREAIAALRRALARRVGGWSEYNGRGVWYDDSGARFEETHVRFEVWTQNALQTEQVLTAHNEFGAFAGEQSLARVVNGRASLVPAPPTWPPVKG